MLATLDRTLEEQWSHGSAFGARHHITQPGFYAWRRELQQRDATALVPLQVETNDQPARATSIPTIEVVLVSG